jgi:hypothetical protein
MEKLNSGAMESAIAPPCAGWHTPALHDGDPTLPLRASQALRLPSPKPKPSRALREASWLRSASSGGAHPPALIGSAAMDAVSPTPQDEYPTTAVVAATLATLCFPLISLIVALLLMGGQRSERKRAQLRMWAWAAGAWIALWVLFVALFLAV